MVEHIIPINKKTRNAVAVLLEAAELGADKCLVVVVHGNTITVRSTETLSRKHRAAAAKVMLEAMHTTQEVS